MSKAINEDIRRMREYLLTLPSQILHESKHIGKFPNMNGVKHVVFSGQGGSSIAGEITAKLMLRESSIPISVNRNYTLPSYVGKDTLVIILSYSGQTAESLSAYSMAVRKKARIICITSGGQLLKNASRKNHYAIVIPGLFPPRTAIGYLLGASLWIAKKLGSLSIMLSTKKIATFSNTLVKQYSMEDKENEAFKIASTLKRKTPIIYSSEDLLSPVAKRWKGQFEENAKKLAFVNQLPEMNHNEIVGWSGEDASFYKQVGAIFLLDKGDNKENKKRMAITEQMIRRRSEVITISSQGKNILERMLSLIILGDWVSYYLAIQRRVSPLEISAIDFLKKKMGT